MNVCFFRHGPALQRARPGMAEKDRPLTPEGRKKTVEAAKGLSKLDLGIDEILTSPLPRAAETAAILADVLQLEPPKSTDLLLPGVPPARMLEVLKGTSARAPVLVGHETGLSRAVSLMISGSDESIVELKKAGLALVELRWMKPRPAGVLRLLLSPRALRRVR